MAVSRARLLDERGLPAAASPGGGDGRERRRPRWAEWRPGPAPGTLVQMADLDPSEDATYRRLRRWALRCAYALGGISQDGEDGLHDVLMQIQGGDSRPLRRGEISFKTCVHNRIAGAIRQRRLHGGIAVRRAAAGLGVGSAETSPFLALVGVTREEDLLELQALVAPALRQLEAEHPLHARAFAARLREQLLEAGGAEELEAFQRWYGLDLGRHTGTRALAEASGEPGGTTANRAFRGEERLVKVIRRWLEQGRGEGR